LSQSFYEAKFQQDKIYEVFYSVRTEKIYEVFYSVRTDEMGGLIRACYVCTYMRTCIQRYIPIDIHTCIQA
jgi:hypothetical protein